MNRVQWRAFHHAIRHDAWAFREIHGGYPCFTRRLTHNGEEWSFTRVRNDGARWVSYLRKSLIPGADLAGEPCRRNERPAALAPQAAARAVEPTGVPAGDRGRRAVCPSVAYGCAGGGVSMFGTYCRLGVPVWSTDRQVIRAARQLLSATARRRLDLRAERHAFYRKMLDFHRGQQALCREFRL